MSDILVKAEGVSKKFCKSLKRSMLYGMQDIAKNIFGQIPKTDELKPDEFWAVDDISFELRRGECIGLIGPNGSGKSTLLKILNGIISPDRGLVKINGKTGALIEIGAGFHPMLTGRENIYVNGSILGFSKREIDKKFNKIVDFAELSEFIDTPVKHYSSGMHVRLGFAIAAQMDPDVLLIDEVLAVGDIGFKAKCFSAISKLTRKCAVIFVSHNMPNISKLATDILVMNKGYKEFQGRDISKGIHRYLNQFPVEMGVRFGENKVFLKNSIIRDEKESNGIVKYLEDLFIDIEFIFLNKCWADILMLIFTDKEVNNIAVTYLHIPKEQHRINKQNRMTVRIPQVPFSAGNYAVTITFAKAFKNTVNGEIISQYHSAISFRVIDSRTVSNIPIQFESELVRFS